MLAARCALALLLAIPHGLAAQTLADPGPGWVPAGTHYYYGTKEETHIAVTTTGPFVLTYVNPGNDPSRRGPFGQ